MSTRWMFAGVPVANGSGTDVVTLTVGSAEEASTVGSYLSDIAKVMSGWMPLSEFGYRWAGVEVGGVGVESRPEHAVEALRQAGPPPGIERYRKIVSRGPS